MFQSKLRKISSLLLSLELQLSFFISLHLCESNSKSRLATVNVRSLWPYCLAAVGSHLEFVAVAAMLQFPHNGMGGQSHIHLILEGPHIDSLFVAQLIAHIQHVGLEDKGGSLLISILFVFGDEVGHVVLEPVHDFCPLSFQQMSRVESI
jgi:hypothetical protein